MAKMGRPKKEIDQQRFEDLCALQCTLDEVCETLGVSDKTLNAWCKKVYGETFSAVFEKKRGRGKISLRRMQFRLAEKNAAMAIFLGKQYLGQRDTVDVGLPKLNEKDDALSESLKEMAKELDSDG